MIFKFFLDHFFMFYILVVFIVFGQAGAQKGKKDSACPSSGSNSKLSKRFQCAKLPPMDTLLILANPDYSNQIKDGAFLEDFLPNCKTQKTIGTSISTHHPSTQTWPSGQTPPSVQTQTQDQIQTTSTEMTTTTTKEKPDIATPYAKKLKGEKLKGDMLMREGGHIVIRGEVHENPEFLNISLLYNAPEWHYLLGAPLLNIHVNFSSKSIAFSSYFSGNWTFKNESDEIPEGNPYENINFFECKIEAQEEFFLISVISTDSDNEQHPYTAKWMHRLPIWAFNWFQIEGNVTIWEPEIHLPKINNAGSKFSTELDNILEKGDSIEVHGKVPPNASLFAFYLLHEIAEFSPIFGETIMRMRFNFTKGTDFRWAYFDNYDHEEGKFSHWRGVENPLHAMAEFLIGINVTDAFLIYNYEEQKAKKISTFNQYLPAWSVNQIWVTGDVLITPGYPKLVKKNQNENNKMKYLDDKIPKTGDVIKLNGITSEKSNIYISLFSGATTFDKQIGETVLVIHLVGDGLISFRTAINGTYDSELTGKLKLTNLKAMPKAGQKLAFEIKVLPDFYDITINAVTDPTFTFSYQYDHILPAWAVEYVVVRGDLDMEGQITILTNDN